MTEGSIVKKIVAFALPLFMGQLLQQLYNVIDSVVVGNVLGKEALAAVSSSGSLIFLIVGFVNGLFMGSSVIIGKGKGAGDKKAIEVAAHTSVAFGLIMGVVLTLVGIFLTPILLRWMGTPADVFPNSVLYFRIYFCGGLFNVMYCTFAGIFQAVGDSKHPLYYLIASTVTNTILDILFVQFLGFGIGGAAAATAISQCVSAVLAFIKLTHVNEEHRIEVSKIRIDWPTLTTELRIGIPTGIQNCVIALANVIVQSNINAFGSEAMAGCGSYMRTEGFAFLPITCICMALTTFTSQNIGAGKFERVRKGARVGIAISVTCAEAIGLLLFIFCPYILRIFSQEADVLAIGILQSRTESLFFCLLALTHCFAGIMRGAGKTKVPMFIMLGCWCLFRITYITIAVQLFPVIQTIFWAYPITWSMSSIIFVIYYFKANWLKK